MCRFICAVLPAGADLDALSAVATGHGRRLRPMANPSLQVQLHPGETLCLTTPGHCDCDAALGRFRAGPDSPDRNLERWRRKGWSESKIARAVQQQGEHVREKAAAEWAQAQAELGCWRVLIAALLDSVPYLGLLVHDFDGPLDEEIRLGERRKIRQASVEEVWLGSLAEDVLYEIRSEAG